MARAVQYISPDELAELILEGPEDEPRAHVIDVRDEDFAGGHIPNAKHVPSASFATQVGYLAQELAGSSSLLVFHCMFSQQRGPSCANCFVRHVADHDPNWQCDVRVLSGGFHAWDMRFGTRPDASLYVVGRCHDNTPDGRGAVTRFMTELAKSTGKYCFGIADTVVRLEAGAVETVLLWDGLDHRRQKAYVPDTKEQVVRFLRPSQDQGTWCDDETGKELDCVEEMGLVEWIARNHEAFGATLAMVSDTSPEGSQFVKGFGGIGGILKYRADLDSHVDATSADSNDWG